MQTQKMEFDGLFDALSHAGVHGIFPINGGSVVGIDINDESAGIIWQCENDGVKTSDGWAWGDGQNTIAEGTGIDALLDLIRTKTKQ